MIDGLKVYKKLLYILYFYNSKAFLFSSLEIGFGIYVVPMVPEQIPIAGLVVVTLGDVIVIMVVEKLRLVPI